MGDITWQKHHLFISLRWRPSWKSYHLEILMGLVYFLVHWPLENVHINFHVFIPKLTGTSPIFSTKLAAILKNSGHLGISITSDFILIRPPVENVHTKFQVFINKLTGRSRTFSTKLAAILKKSAILKFQLARFIFLYSDS